MARTYTLTQSIARCPPTYPQQHTLRKLAMLMKVEVIGRGLQHRGRRAPSPAHHPQHGNRPSVIFTNCKVSKFELNIFDSQDAILAVGIQTPYVVMKQAHCLRTSRVRCVHARGTRLITRP